MAGRFPALKNLKGNTPHFHMRLSEGKQILESKRLNEKEIGKE